MTAGAPEVRLHAGVAAAAPASGSATWAGASSVASLRSHGAASGK